MTTRKITAERIAALPQRPEQTATIAAWLVHAPGQSPAWEHYMVGVVHLREIEGAPAAKLHTRDASHEFIVAALDPGRGPRADDPTTIEALHPLNHVQQFSGLTDEGAERVCTQLVEKIVKGECWVEPPLSTGGGADALISKLLTEFVSLEVVH